jgi:hypothetical protein
MKLNPNTTLHVIVEMLEKMRGLLVRSDAPRGESFDELADALQVAWVSATRLSLELDGTSDPTGLPN